MITKDEIKKIRIEGQNWWMNKFKSGLVDYQDGLNSITLNIERFIKFSEDQADEFWYKSVLRELDMLKYPINQAKLSIDALVIISKD